jgi:hypothetical protein
MRGGTLEPLPKAVHRAGLAVIENGNERKADFDSVAAHARLAVSPVRGEARGYFFVSIRMGARAHTLHS